MKGKIVNFCLKRSIEIMFVLYVLVAPAVASAGVAAFMSLGPSSAVVDNQNVIEQSQGFYYHVEGSEIPANRREFINPPNASHPIPVPIIANERCRVGDLDCIERETPHFLRFAKATMGKKVWTRGELQKWSKGKFKLRVNIFADLPSKDSVRILEVVPEDWDRVGFLTIIGFDDETTSTDLWGFAGDMAAKLGVDVIGLEEGVFGVGRNYMTGIGGGAGASMVPNPAVAIAASIIPSTSRQTGYMMKRPWIRFGFVAPKEVLEAAKEPESKPTRTVTNPSTGSITNTWDWDDDQQERQNGGGQ